MNTTTNSPEILESIDCTPTWEALLLPMLDLYVQNSQFNGGSNDSLKSMESNKANLLQEFKRMAQAADNWNKYAKQNLPR